jgi:hypothetical protein
MQEKKKSITSLFKKGLSENGGLRLARRGQATQRNACSTMVVVHSKSASENEENFL